MFFIHETTCISPQQTFLQDKLFDAEISSFNPPVNNILFALEPKYDGVPPGVLRRMGRAVRLGIGAAMPLLQQANKIPDGIIIGTPMGGMEDCVKFLNQVVEYEEGQLTPTNFVQSTPNAIAGQLGLLNKNKGYNITHVHRGHSFENAVIDVDMLLKEHAGTNYLLGAVDEISNYNYNIERLGGWYKDEPCSPAELYESATKGSIAGESSSMFLVDDDAVNAIAKLLAVHIFHTKDERIVHEQLQQFLQSHLQQGETIDLLLSGENGDKRFLHFYNSCELVIGNKVPVARFKHISGEHPTAVAFACWMACEILMHNFLPENMRKKGTVKNIKRILIYNNFKGIQHSFMLLEKA